MKPIVYKRVSIEGFQSFGKSVHFNLDRVGINLIKGVNGAGKSTIFNAILWAEYGGNFKKSVETWEENRPDTYRGVRVVIERTDGVYDYMVARHLGFKGTTKGLKGGDKLMIFRKPVDKPHFLQEDLIGDGLHKSDMQEEIIKQLGMDERTFLSSIMFGQRMKSLVEVPNADKRKLFEELFNLDFIETCKEKAKIQESELSEEVVNHTSKVDSFALKIENAESRIAEQKEIKENFLTEKAKRLKEFDDEISDYEGELSTMREEILQNEKDLEKFDSNSLKLLQEEVEEFTEKYDSAKSAEKSAKKLYDECVYEIEKSNGKIRKFEQDIENVEETCPHCGGRIDAKKVKDVKGSFSDAIKAEKKVIAVLEKNSPKLLTKWEEAKVDTTEVYGSLNDAEVRLLECTEGNKKFFDIRQKNATLTGSIVSVERNIERLKKLRATEEEVEMPKLIIEELEENVSAYKLDMSEQQEMLDSKLETLSKVQWWIKTGFGASGLKSFVFNSMLNQLNMYAQKYAGRLGFGVEFTVDMTKASKPFQTLVYKGDQIKNYEDFSGGQKQRVDVCLAFAMHDLITHKSNINILVMDETITNLDSEGVETFFDLLRQKAEEKSIYLITHVDIVDSLGAVDIYVDLDESGNSYIQV